MENLQPSNSESDCEMDLSNSKFCCEMDSSNSEMCCEMDTSNSEFNFKMDSSCSEFECETDCSDLDDKIKENGPVKFRFSKDNVLTFTAHEIDETVPQENSISLRMGNILMDFKSPELINEIRKIISSTVEKNVSKEEFQILKHNSKVLKFSDNEITNNAASITPKTNLAGHDDTIQLPMSSNHMALSTNIEQGDNIDLLGQLRRSIKDSEKDDAVSKCKKCKNICILFNENTCAKCCLCKLSNITLTKIDKLGTSSSSNSIPIEESDLIVISSEEEDKEEPPVTAKSEIKKNL